ncbi:hypothetical protein RZT35_004994 [Salmonella enterica]|nr:hypothetical protein [Salmonella enterica]
MDNGIIIGGDDEWNRSYNKGIPLMFSLTYINCLYALCKQCVDESHQHAIGVQIRTALDNIMISRQ